MKKLFLLPIAFFSVAVFAQPPKRFFTKFGGNGIDVGYSAKVTKDKQYIIAGSTSSYGAGNTDVYLVKLDTMGFPIWQKTYGGFNNDVGKSVIQLPDSGYVVAGFTNSFGAGGYDVYIVKTDKNGNLIWQKTFGGLDWDFANDLVLTPDGDIAVVGNTSSFGKGKKDGLFLKFDFSGNLVQQKFIGGAENEELKSIIVTNDFLLASVGYTESNGETNGDAYFVKFDLNGDTLFTKYFGGAGKDYANDIVQKSNTEYVICGAKTYTINSPTQAFMYSLNIIGNFLWENHKTDILTVDEAFLSNCNITYNSNLTAYVRNWQKSQFKMQVSIFVGTLLGNANFQSGFYYVNEEGGPEDEFCYSIEATSDGGTIEVGTTNSYGSINGDLYFLKRDSLLINNKNIVGIKENIAKKSKPILRYLNNSELEIVLSDDLRISNYRIIAIDGALIFEEKVNLNELKIDLNSYPKTLLVLEIKLKSGEIFRYKI